jgi:hypothetical protein
MSVQGVIPTAYNFNKKEIPAKTLQKGCRARLAPELTRSKIIRALKGTSTATILTKACVEDDTSSSLHSDDWCVDLSDEL